MTRVCCLNVLFDDRNTKVSVYKHPIFNPSSDLVWPPPNSKELCCWYCCHTCENPVPMCCEHDKKKDIFYVSGIFCSFSCAKSYIIDKYKWTSSEPLMLLDYMARNVFNSRVDHQAPPKQRLKIFGGDLTIEEFRSGIYSNDTVLCRPITSSPEIYERIEHINNFQTPNKKVKKDKTDKQAETSSNLYEQYIKQQSQTSSSSKIAPGTLNAFMKTPL